MIFPRDKINTIPLEYSPVKCYNGISVRLRMNSVTIIYQEYFCTIAVNYISSNVVKKYQQYIIYWGQLNDCHLTGPAAVSCGPSRTIKVQQAPIEPPAV